ncbi:MAG: hypothetical protein Q8P41_09995 [Pseudomonadota bacterium]|nr:hypothetical protein [Pseudomonadota bacterium]
MLVGIGTPTAVQRKVWGEPFYALPSPDNYRAAVYVMRLTHRDQAASLPGLDQREADGRLAPSLLRDAAELAIRNGSGELDVAIVHVPEDEGRAALLPWELAPTPVIEELDQVLDRYLERRLGAVIVVPDAGGPTLLVPGAPLASVAERRTRLVQNVQRLSRRWHERYQVGLVDVVAEEGRVLDDEHWLEPLVNLDLGVCAWAGDLHALGRHGWRCAAAAVGAALAKGMRDLGDGGVAPALSKRKLELGPGRVPLHVPPVWAVPAPPQSRPQSRQLVVVEAAADDVGRVLAETSLRAPLGDWPLTAVWTARLIVRRIETVAAAFVFANANPVTVEQLRIAMAYGLRVFIAEGILVSPKTGSTVEIHVAVEGERQSPRLVVEMAAILRPWQVQIDVNVEVVRDVGARVTLT